MSRSRGREEREGEGGDSEVRDILWHGPLMRDVTLEKLYTLMQYKENHESES